MTKKIIFVDRLGAHSIWNVLDPVANRLIKQGYDVCYCRMDDGKQRDPLTQPKHVKTVDITVPFAKTPFHFIIQQIIWFYYFSAFIIKYKPNLTHTNFVIPGAVSRFACKLFRKGKVVSTRHELQSSMNNLLQLLDNKTSKHIDHSVYISQVVADSYTLNRCEGSIIHNGIDNFFLEGFIKPEDKKNNHHIVCVGRILPVKGQSLLLRSIPTVLSKFPNASLTLVGSGSDEGEILQTANELGITDKVKITGWVSREYACDIVSSAGTIVIPSDGTQEGFGLIVAEALALEVPIVCSDIDVFKEVAGDTAMMFKAGDSDLLASAIINVFDHHQDARERCILGKQRALDKFSVEGMIEGYLSVYNRLLFRK
ncbi:glycosyltransferase family 4 protein [Vibrio sp. F13]|uniref:glycosyltransferase family 4 protein n=1 Tax=Vibrio sp. F13 TaxID=2070777 RepID=UPI001482A700|nr:glycosyltransferase family 4 protein [Vibrio sp. F13]